MSDLISREAFKEELLRLGFFPAIVKGALDRQPTIDAVPVVHCKDCKQWGCGLPMETDHVKCCSVGGYMVGKNGYCCYGEKKK